MENNQKVSENLEKLSLLAKFLGLLEKVLPAFLIAWNNQLKQNNKQLELKLEKKEIQDEVREKKEQIASESKDPKEVINKFLGT